ncbi:MAG: DUF3592 domain-containing protein [Deltaproteobacteria bacterium]|nr:MAG: DUF3592 domain-containing protein [Deltaproteobacteria bacterium]
MRIVGAVLGVVGVALAGFGAAGLLRSGEADEWTPTEAKVVSIKAKVFDKHSMDPSWTPGTRRTAVAVRYTYEVDGQRYESERFSPEQELQEFSGSEEDALIARMAELDSRVVTAYVNPANPEQSVIDLGGDPRAPWFFGGGLVLLLAGGGVAVAGGKRG